jgi:uncharacterized protein YjgD (DUF1641 family)
MTDNHADETTEIDRVVSENPEAIAESLETLVRLQETGTLDDLVGVADALALLSAAMDDEMVTTLASTGARLGEVADTAADEDVARGLESTLAAVGEATDAEPERLGIVGLARAMRDPQVQTGMGFLVAVARALGSDLDEQANRSR